MDPNRRYGWRHHNYIFDANQQKFVLQHRTSSTNESTASSINDINHNDDGENGENHNNYLINNRYKNINGRSSQSIDTRYQQKLQCRYGGNRGKIKVKRNWNESDDFIIPRSKTPTPNLNQTKNEKKRRWTKSKKGKSKSLKLRPKVKESDKPKLNINNESISDSNNLNISLPTTDSNNSYIILTQYNTRLILSNWYRTFYEKQQKIIRREIRSNLRRNRLIISYLMSYTIECFEFDEHHPFVQTWINYNICSLIDDDIPKSKSIPIHLIKSITSSNEDDVECNSDSLSISNDSSPPLLSPSVSVSNNAYSLTSQTSICSNSSALHSRGLSSSSMNNNNKYNKSKTINNKYNNNKQYHNTWECTASLPNVKWSTIFLGTILNSQLLYKNIYVFNVIIDKLGYGVGFAFFGHNNREFDNDIFYNQKNLNKEIQDKYGGYPDNMTSSFVLYDDGSYYDWNSIKKENVNELPHISSSGKRNHNNTIKLISKLSKHKLKTDKTKQFELNISDQSPLSSPNYHQNLLSVPSDTENENNSSKKQLNKKKMRKKIRSKSKKDFYSNPKQKRANMRKKNMLKSKSDNLLIANHSNNNDKNSNSNTLATKKRNFYGKKRAKYKSVKKVTDKFSFDEKSDVIQISIDLYHKRILIHNLNNHRCVVIKDFNFDSIRIGFVLRYSNVTVIDQKWI